jgi:hypothetical protein
MHAIQYHLSGLHCLLPGLPYITPDHCRSLEETRVYLQRLMRRGIEPEMVHSVGWKPGMVAIWDNWAVCVFSRSTPPPATSSVVGGRLAFRVVPRVCVCVCGGGGVSDSLHFAALGLLTPPPSLSLSRSLLIHVYPHPPCARHPTAADGTLRQAGCGKRTDG